MTVIGVHHAANLSPVRNGWKTVNTCLTNVLAAAIPMQAQWRNIILDPMMILMMTTMILIAG